MQGLYPTDDVSSLLQNWRAQLLEFNALELPKELRAAPGRAYLIPVTWTNTPQVVLYLPVEFPDERPVVFLTAQGITKRVFPHINRDGQICTFAVGTVVNPFRPAEQIMAVLQNAQRVVERQYSPEEELAEIEPELVAYWSSGEPFLFLTDGTLEAHRIVNVRFADAMYEATKRRVHYVAPMPGTIPNRMQVGLVLDIPRAKLIDFLNDPAKTIAEEASWKEGCTLLAHTLSMRNHTQKTITVFVFAKCATSKGAVWLGGFFLHPFHLRKALAQNEVGLARLPLGSPFYRCVIESLRTERLLKRAEGQAANRYVVDKAVTLVGCGSIGSFMADLLFRSGIQRMLLIDKEILESANLSRHLLDSTGLFLSKAEQLRLRLVHRCPEGKVEAHYGDARRAEGLRRITDFSSAINIIATGDTNTDMTLSEFCRRGRISACCFVWVEADLRAGHVVYQPRGCAQSLVDLHGPGYDGRHLYHHRMITDPNQGQCQEHACQFTFTPYSAIDAVSFAAAATRKVIEWLSRPPQEMQILRRRVDSSDQWETVASTL